MPWRSTMTIEFSTPPGGRHGGARRGSGPKPAGYVKPAEVVDYDEARARNEAAKADLNELELSIRRGEHVERAWVCQCTAAALATLAQTLRSVPDNLERRLGLNPETAQEVGLMIDNALGDLATQFEDLAGAAEEGIKRANG